MKKMNYIYKLSAAVAFAAAMILSASCSKERQFKGDVTGSAEVRFEASVASNTTSVTTKSGVLTGADGISIPFTMVSEPGINGGAGDAIDTKGTLYNTTGEDMALAAAGINKFRVAAFNQDKSYFIPAMTDVNYADGKWSTATPYTWAGGEEKLFVAFGNFDGDITFSLDDGSLSGSFAQDIPDEASAQKEILISGYAGNGDSDEDGICDGEVSMIFQHLNTSVVFKMGDMLGVSKIKRIALENVLARREFSFDEEFDITHGDVEPVKTVWQDVNALPEVGEQIGEAFILHEQGLENVILHVYVTISGRDYDLVARLGSDTWMAGNTNVYTLGFGDTVVEPVCFTSDAEQNLIMSRITYLDSFTPGVAGIKSQTEPDVNLWYSYDKNTWLEWTSTMSPVKFGTAEHPSVYVIGKNPDGFNGSFIDGDEKIYIGNVFNFIDGSGNPTSIPVTVSGNIMSLIDYSEKLTAFPAGTEGQFVGLFAFSPVTDASGLVLPVKTLAPYCYTGLFAFCPQLENAPVLSATTLAEYCYTSMFESNAMLSEAPALPAMTLAPYCYRSMFANCTSLAEAPALPSTSLAYSCYDYMFAKCTSLVEAPELLATTLVERCYWCMFTGCSNLNYIKMLATDITAANCLTSWTSSVAETGTFVKDSALQTGTGTNQIRLDSPSGIPTGWTVYDIIEPVVEPVCFTAAREQQFIFPRITYCETTGIIELPLNPSVNAELWYSYDKVSWARVTDTLNPVVFGTDSHPSVYVIGHNPDGFDGSFVRSDAIYKGSLFYFLNPDVDITISGNIMSIIDYSQELESFKSGTTGCMLGLFAFSPVTDASGLSLPVKTLPAACYLSMFCKCSKLVAPPVLPATTVGDYCYANMFNGCSSLKVAPEIYAVNLSTYCCWAMFKFCSSLTTAPALPAETLADNCYRDMFGCCTGLQTAPVLPAKTLAEGCYRYMFEDCTNLQIAPVLPAATLVENCYRSMFSSCENLNRIEMLATDITAPNCLGSWTWGVPESGTFVKSPALGTRTNASDDNTRICLDSENGIPTGWTVKNIGLPDGALSGLFTVADDGDGNVKKVYFSKGNLYCSRPSSESSDWTWHFYDNQYDFNSLNSSCDGYGCREAEASDTEIDLFSWGYSAEHSLNPVTTDFVTGHPNDYDELVYDQPSSSGGDDWGVAYCESNGIPTGTWRTLTTAEWQYLLAWDVEEPDTSLPRCGLSKPGVTVCGQVNCVVLLPDDWNEGVISLAQFAETTEYGDATDVTWAEMEAAGAVCLPAAGERNDGSIAGVREWGLYWSSSAMDDKAYCILFFSDTLSSEEYEGRHSSKSVRLVSECK